MTFTVGSTSLAHAMPRRHAGMSSSGEAVEESHGQCASMCNTTMPNMAAEASVVPATPSVARGA